MNLYWLCALKSPNPQYCWWEVAICFVLDQCLFAFDHPIHSSFRIESVQEYFHLFPRISCHRWHLYLRLFDLLWSGFSIFWDRFAYIYILSGHVDTSSSRTGVRLVTSDVAPAEPASCPSLPTWAIDRRISVIGGTDLPNCWPTLRTTLKGWESSESPSPPRFRFGASPPRLILHRLRPVPPSASG